MPAHDNASTIGAAIESVLRQTRLGLGADRRRRRLRATEPLTLRRRSPIRASRVVRQTENRGPGATRNRGISVAQAPLICPLDSDDLWLPEYLETMASALDSNPDCRCRVLGRVGASTSEPGGSGRSPQSQSQNPPEPIPDDPQTFLVELLRRNFVYYSVAARRESLLAVGGYDERLWVGEDWELWLRLAAAGFRFVFVPQLLGLHRKRAGSLTSTLGTLARGQTRGLPRRRRGLGREPRDSRARAQP